MGMRSFCCVITTLTCTSILIRRNISAFALDKKRYYPTPNVIPALISRSGRLRGQKFPFLSFSAESGLGRILSNTSPVNHARRGMDIAFTADLAATLLAMVKAGDGIAWLPESLAAPDVQAGTIAAAAPQKSGLWVPIDIRLFRPAGRMSRAVEELWEIFVDEQR